MVNKIINIITNFSILRSSLLTMIVALLLSVCLIFWLKRKSRIDNNIFDFSRSSKIKKLIYLATVLMLIAITLIIIILTVKPKVIYPTDPSLQTSLVSRDNPIEIKFDRPINKKTIKGEISPDIKGQWVASSGFFKKENKLTFVPSESLALETRYTVSLSGIKNSFSKESKYLFSFQTRSIPKILSITPENGDEGALPNQEITIEAEQFSSDQVKFEFELNPTVPVDTKQENSKFILTPKESLIKGTSYGLKVYYTLISYDYESGETKLLSEKTEAASSVFKVVSVLGIKSYHPTGTGILIDTPISIEFSQDMDKKSAEDAFSTSPTMQGKFSWSDNRTINFAPSQNFQKNTKYAVTLSKNAKTAEGENIEESLTYDFTTIGPVAVSSFSPSNGTKNVDTSTKVAVTFDQAVDHQSAESNFSLNSGREGSFAWDGNIMTFSPSELSFSQTYEIKIASGVKTVLGLDSDKDFTATFQTRAQSTTLNVTAYKQSHMYSCMISAARSALAYRGIIVSEATIISKVGYDTTPWSGTWNEAGSTWGDPNTGIVGDLDGKANNIGWGYGSYWNPISSAIQSLGRSNEVKSDMTASSLAAEIAAGNPVIVWWVNGVWPSYELFWYKNGTKIRAVNGMHVVVVKGFTGTVDDPTSITVTDSGYGYPGKTLDTATFLARWGWFGNTGIVVR